MLTKRNTVDKTTQLRDRLNEMSDRIAVLEHTLKRTQEMIQSDMKMLFEKVNGR